MYSISKWKSKIEAAFVRIFADESVGVLLKENFLQQNNLINNKEKGQLVVVYDSMLTR